MARMPINVFSRSGAVICVHFNRNPFDFRSLNMFSMYHRSAYLLMLPAGWQQVHIIKYSDLFVLELIILSPCRYTRFDPIVTIRRMVCVFPMGILLNKCLTIVIRFLYFTFMFSRILMSKGISCSNRSSIQSFPINSRSASRLKIFPFPTRVKN